MPTWSCTLRHAISAGMSIKRSQLRAKVNDVRPPLVSGRIRYGHTVLEKLAEERNEDGTTKKSALA